MRYTSSSSCRQLYFSDKCPMVSKRESNFFSEAYVFGEHEFLRHNSQVSQALIQCSWLRFAALI